MRVAADMDSATGETMSIDDIDVGDLQRRVRDSRGCARGRPHRRRPRPGATLTGEVEVNHTSVGSGDNDWESTSYQFEGGTLECEDTDDHTDSDTDRESFPVVGAERSAGFTT